MDSRTRNRDWSKVRAHDEWLKIVADKQNWADEQGPPSNPKRCFIPSWMTCAARVKNVVENYELKQTERRLKERKMSMEEEEQLNAETRLGFHARLAPVDSQSICRPLAPGAYTSTDDAPATTTLLLQAANISETQSKEPRATKGDGHLDASPPRGCGGTPKEKAPAMFDLRGSQNSMVRTETKEWTNLEAKFAARVGLLVSSMETYCNHSLATDVPEFEVAAERLQVSLLWLNSKPVVTQNGGKLEVQLERIPEEASRKQDNLVFLVGA